MKLPSLEKLCPWYRAHKRDLPWRHTKDPYRIWVSEIMLQQTRVEAVIPYYERFLSVLPTVKDLAEAPEALLLKLWEGLGYYSRVRNMQKAAKEIQSVYGGEFPHKFEEVRGLCGIGDYTAGAICSFAFDSAYPAVDGNVLRVCARLADYREDVLCTTGKKELTEAVAKVQPKEEAADFNQALIELGAIVCLPNGAPKCEICPLAAQCLGKKNGTAAQLPIRKKPAPRKKEAKTVLILRYGDLILLRKRPETGLLAGLFEPLCLPEKQSAAEVKKELAALGISAARIAPLGDAKHIFTHLEWYMTGYEVLLAEDTPVENLLLPEGYFFVPHEDLDRRFALPSAYSAYRAFM